LLSISSGMFTTWLTTVAELCCCGWLGFDETVLPDSLCWLEDVVAGVFCVIEDGVVLGVDEVLVDGVDGVDWVVDGTVVVDGVDGVDWVVDGTVVVDGVDGVDWVVDGTVVVDGVDGVDWVVDGTVVVDGVDGVDWVVDGTVVVDGVDGVDWVVDGAVVDVDNDAVLELPE
jgi:hypothetical protein